MPTVEATHWICGTTVSAEVPDDYDLEEGVALACTRCQDVWWHYPLAHGVTGETGVDAMIAGRRREPSRALGHGAPQRLVTNWLGPALVLCVLALVLLRLADLGPRSTAAPRSGATGQANRNARPANPNAFVVVRAPQYTIGRPARWITFPRNGATVLAPSARAPISVAVYADRRPELSVTQMASLGQQLLETQLPKAKITGPSPVRLSRLSGQRLSARQGAVLREMVVVASGDYRYVIQISARAGASREQLARLGRIVRSFRATP